MRLFDLLNTLVWCKMLLGSEKPYLLLPELLKWRVITYMNPRNLQPTLVLVTRSSHATKRADSNQKVRDPYNKCAKVRNPRNKRMCAQLTQTVGSQLRLRNRSTMTSRPGS